MIIIILIIGLFYILFKSIENFSNKNYTNTNVYPIQINSSLPYDIIIKNENSSYYDYGNDELNEKFIKIFDINQKKLIKMIEGIEWSNWMIITDDIISKYSKKIINKFENNIKNDLLKLKNNPDYKIIKTNSNRYKYSLNNKLVLLDIDIILYRPNKPLARHIKIIAVSNSIYVKFLMVKVIGVIKECDLFNKLYVPLKP
jgi:succinate dehydrogenase flavin-adding protein (antitoxin of CptAB toxin-antitoxin module)